MDDILCYVRKAKDGEEIAFKFLLSKYNALITSMSQKYSNMCITSSRLYDDFLQEAKIAFYSSVKSFDEDAGITFGAYAKICIRNRLISCVRVHNSKKRQKRSNLNDNYDFGNPQDNLITREFEKKLFSLAQDCLSPYEKKIFSYYMAGEKAKEISKKIDRSEKSVNNAIFRIKAKLKRTINQGT